MRDYKPKTISPALTASMYKEPPVVLDLVKSTSTQHKFIKNNSLTTKTMETSHKLNQRTYQTLISLTEGISDTQRYKCLGNAVTVNVIQYLINKLI